MYRKDDRHSFICDIPWTGSTHRADQVAPDEVERCSLHLPDSLFKNNTKLRSLTLRLTKGTGADELNIGGSFASQNLLKHLENLESIEIY